MLDHQLPSDYTQLDLPGRLHYVDDMKKDVMQLQYRLIKIREQMQHNPLVKTATTRAPIVRELPPLRFHLDQNLRGHKSRILVMRAMSQGTRHSTTVATLAQDCMCVLWDVTTGLKFEAFPVSRGHTASMAVNSSGRLVTTGGLACTVDVYATNEKLNAQLGDPMPPFEFNFDRGMTLDTQNGMMNQVSNPLFATGMLPGGQQTGIAQPATGWGSRMIEQYVTTLSGGHDACISAQEFLGDGNLLSGSEDATVVQWDVHMGRQVTKFTGHTAGILGLAVSPRDTNSTDDPNVFASMGAESAIKLWDVRTGNSTMQFSGRRRAPFHTARFLGDKQTILAGDGYGLALFDLRTNDVLQYYPSPRGFISSMAISRSGRLAVVGSDDGMVTVLDLLRSQTVVQLDGHKDHISAVEIVDGIAMTASWDGTVRIWVAET